MLPPHVIESFHRIAHGTRAGIGGEGRDENEVANRRGGWTSGGEVGMTRPKSVSGLQVVEHLDRCERCIVCVLAAFNLAQGRRSSEMK